MLTLQTSLILVHASKPPEQRIAHMPALTGCVTVDNLLHPPAVTFHSGMKSIPRSTQFLGSCHGSGPLNV